MTKMGQPEEKRPDLVEEIRARRKALFDAWSQGGDLAAYTRRVHQWAQENGYVVTEPPGPRSTEIDGSKAQAVR